MNNSVEKLWQEEKRRSRKIVLWIISLIFASLFVTSALCLWVTQPLIFTPEKQDAGNFVSAERLRIHVEKLSKDFAPRSVSFPQNLERTAKYIEQQFESAGGKVTEQKFQVNGAAYRNVSAFFGAEAKPRIVVGAHYDSAGNFPAADDNASGVAGLIELAYLLGKTEIPTRIELVAYALEEPPFFGTEQMGSFIHANSLRDNAVPVRLMISLEMIGYFSDAPGSQKYPISLLGLLYPSQGNFVAVVGGFDNAPTIRQIKAAMTASGDLPVYSINAPGFVNGTDFSDHRNYRQFGYNAVMITDTAFYRNPNYHAAGDVAEKLDYNRMAKVVRSVYQAVVEVAK